MSSRLLDLCRAVVLCLLAAVFPAALQAQPLVKTAVSVDPGNTKQTGQNFGYRLTYNCSSTSGPCLGAEVVDLLPIEVQFVSTVPASPTGDVMAINVTPNFMGSGRTRVQFVMISPLPAGNSGDLLINVRFPAGSTPDGATASNTGDGINLETTPGTFTTPPVVVTAVASPQVTVQKTLQTTPANLDMPETYRLRISVPNNPGALNLTAIGPITDTLPPGTVFNGATPAADCQPGCVGTTPATVTWTSPCALPLTPGNNCDIFVNVTFPSGTFPSGTNVTNSFTGDATPLGEPSQSVGVGSVTHPVTTFIPNPGAGLAKNLTGASPNPPTLNQTFSYELVPTNNGNVPLDSYELIDTLPIELAVTSVTTGAYVNVNDFAPGVGVEVSYEKNTALGVFTLWGSSPDVATNTTLTAPPPGLVVGEYITRLRWRFGQAQPGMAATNTANRPHITGQIVNPDNAGGPVAIGDTIQNCVALTAVYTAGPTNVSVGPVCRNFVVSGPFAQLNPAKDNLSGGGPFNPGQTVSWRLRVRSAPQSSDPLPLEDVTAADLLPVDLVFTGVWTFDDQGTGLPAPQNFEQIPNFAGTGRTLLRWTWNAGSGSLAVNQQVWINITTMVRSGAAAGPLANTFDLEHDAPGLGQRCSGSSQTDALDLDDDGDTAETHCTATTTITVAPIAQLISRKEVQGLCDGDFTTTSAGTLAGGVIDYRLSVQNVGTLAMEDFVIVDILPFVGDTGVRDTNPRGSQWQPLLIAPIAPPPGTVIYYSTSGNPCRGEVGGPVVGCDPPGWTTVPPMPITATRSFKVEFGDQVVGPFDTLTFELRLIAPGDVPPAAIAYNSFAYQGERSDGLGSLAAEPEKRGIAPGTCEAAALGDFVWVDTDGDGTQNDGATGLNDVYVELFTPGDDGIVRTFDDVRLAATLTSDDSLGNPGWYSFPGLAPGSYYVRFHPPATYEVTLPDQGGDDALDSDGDVATACSPVVTLDPDEVDPTIDLGLLPPIPAALGNYVWFDRDADGQQDESPYDGANGVAVKLFVDDGDGTPEPGGDDVLVATTVTADDVYGAPGYYLFDGLDAGVPYFVQFMLPAAATGFTTQNAGGDDAIDSDADTANGTTQVVTLDPGEFDPTIDAGLVAPTGTLALGDQVWCDDDNDGIFAPQLGEIGVDGVTLSLYRDVNGDGEPTLDEFSGTTTTQTVSGFPGRYRFDDLAPGSYLVVVDLENFSGSGALEGKSTSTGNDPAPDPDDDVNGDDNGTDIGALIASQPVTLTDNGEPTSEDGDNDTNLTVDFGFAPAVPVTREFDYGDAPDVVAGTTPGDYRTTALDLGAFHLQEVLNMPFLGACVDADSGTNQNVDASRDDVLSFGVITGTCAVAGDDEDGVSFTNPLVPGTSASITVTAASGTAACVLNAWIDWNHSGVFGDSPGEQIATDQSIASGANAVLSPSVPAAAIPGRTYARFRCSSVGGIGPTGAAGDGEVEDYLVGIQGTEFADAPASYGTQGAGAASHDVDPAAPLLLGSCLDTEPDGQPAAGADGDDSGVGTSRIGLCLDDEDGVTFDTPLVACQPAQLTVTTTTGGRLDAFIDWNGDGSFTGDQVFANTLLATGANVLAFNVPCTATATTTYARFRLSSAGGLGPTGNAPDGEVEDYAVAMLGVVDFGDAPDSYGTLFASGGPNHALLTGFSLGATVDSESNGQPNVGATGDGADEDGVSFPAMSMLTACQSVNLSVTLTNTAGVATPRLDAWIDFDGDGAFNDPRDRIASGLALVAGANTVPVNVPCNARSAASYARFRLSSTGVAGPGGPATDGEIEDWAVTTKGLDFGDAPDPTFPTLLASNGARHAVLPTGNPVLGSTVDTEPNGQPTAQHNGDDNNGSPDDEDGVVFPAVLIPGTPGTMEVSSATGGELTAWIDFNQNGSWTDAGEQVATSLVIGAGTTPVSFPVPVGSPQGSACVRVRIVATGTGALQPNGEAPNGEVEDHLAPMGVEDPAIGVGKELLSVVRDGATALVTFEITLENFGNVPLGEVNATADFATAFAAAASFAVESLTSVEFVVNPLFDGAGDINLLDAGNTLAVGASGQIQVVVRVDPGGFSGPYFCSSLGTGTSPGDVVVTDVSQDGGDPDPSGNGDPGDDNDPTPIIIEISVIEIPTMSEWGLLMLAMLLGGAAVWVLRRRVS